MFRELVEKRLQFYLYSRGCNRIVCKVDLIGMDSNEATGGDGRMIYSWRFPKISAAQFFAVVLALCVFGRSASAMAETSEGVPGAEAEALSSISARDISHWDKTRCEAVLVQLTNAIARLDKRLPAQRDKLDTLRESLRNADANRRRLRRVESAQEDYRQLNAELDRNLDRDSAVQAMDGAMKALDTLFQRLEARESLVQNRLAALAEETDGKRSETIRADVAALEDAEALSRLNMRDIERWDAGDCTTIQERIQAHLEDIRQRRRPALRRERNTLKAALRNSDAYERQRRNAERARDRYVRLNERLNARLERDSQLEKISREYLKLEEQRRQLRMLQAQLANRMKFIRLVESRERSGEPNPNVGG